MGLTPAPATRCCRPPRGPRIRGWEMSAATTKAQMKILEENGMATANAPDAVIADMKAIGKAMMADWRTNASPEGLAVLDRYLALIE